MAVIQQPIADDTVGAWAGRITAVERALEQRGLTHLLAPMAHMRRIIAGMQDGRVEAERGGRVLAVALAEIKRCVAEPLLRFDPAVTAALEKAAPRQVAESGVSPIARALLASEATTVAPPPGPAPIPQAPLAPEARAMLDSLVEADDAELAAVLSSVGAPARPPRSEAQVMRDEIGTLREPLMGAGKGARVLMKGELQPGLLTDLIQLFAQNSETGRLFLEGPAGAASIYFRDGRITDAECDGEQGERGFFLAMQMRQGRFSYQRGVQTEHERIQRSAQHLIMDTLRLIDEGAS